MHASTEAQTSASPATEVGVSVLKRAFAIGRLAIL